MSDKEMERLYELLDEIKIEDYKAALRHAIFFILR